MGQFLPNAGLTRAGAEPILLGHCVIDYTLGDRFIQSILGDSVQGCSRLSIRHWQQDAEGCPSTIFTRRTNESS